MLSSAPVSSPVKPKGNGVYTSLLILVIFMVAVLGVLLGLTRLNTADEMRTFRTTKGLRKAKFYDISKTSRAILQANPSNEGAQYLKFMELSRIKNMTAYRSEYNYPGISPPDPPKWALDTHEYSHQVWLSEPAPTLSLGISEYRRGKLNTAGGSTFYGKQPHT